MSEKTKCPECCEKYKSIGNHWYWIPKHRPDFTQKQKEVITGVMMGDACINRGNKNPNIKCVMSSPNYLEYLDYIFGCLGAGVSLIKTAAEGAKESRDKGFNQNAKAKNYSDVYRWRSKSHPNLQKWADWYSTGKKVWPKDIKLTPTVLKHWYCGDGCWSNKNTSNYITISMSNEINNLEKVNQIFENVGLPAPSNYHISERRSGGKRCNAVWTVEQSKELWEYMGKPLPDFYYKWPKKYH
jgi:hypothetical protein